MTKDDLILKHLEKIQDDTSNIREDIAFLKAKESEHSKNIEKLDSRITEVLEAKIPEIKQELATLKTKAAIGGAIAGSFLGILTAFLSKAMDWMGSLFGH